MIRVQVTDEHQSIDLRTDAPYSPDVLEDLVNRAALLALITPADADAE